MNKNLNKNGYWHNAEFDGINFGIDFGYIIQSPPSYEFPETEQTLTQIPGGNCNHIASTGGYLDVTRTYYLYKNLANNTIEEANKESNILISKLKTKIGYKDLQDTYEPDYYRKAMLSASGSVTNLYNQGLSIQLDFQCKPQHYLISGTNEKNLDLTNKMGTITNEYEYSSKPLFIITKDSNNSDTQITITNSVYSSKYIISIDWTKNTNASCIYIDSEDCICYYKDDSGIIYSANNMVEYLEEFPELKPGNNTITVSDNATIKYIPRWWTL